MHPTTQSLLCCIGESVAGEPTQFLAERAFQAAGLDWKVFTVEVALEQFQAAVNGIRAMRFSGVRFSGQWQQAALAEFAADDPSANFVGRITSAKCAGVQWEAWHATGAGILSAANTQLEPAMQTCVLVGDSLSIRSTLAALPSLPMVPESVVWLEHNLTLPEELAAALQARGIRLVDLPHADDADWSHLDARLESPESSWLLVAEPDKLAGRGQTCLAQAQGHGVVLTTNASESENKHDASNTLKLDLPPGTKMLKTIEWVAAAEAYDLGRWTGNEWDPQILREAYEEFSDF